MSVQEVSFVYERYGDMGQALEVTRAIIPRAIIPRAIIPRAIIPTR